MNSLQLFFWRLGVLCRAVLLTVSIAWCHNWGRGAVRILVRKRHAWSEKTRGRYIWRIARRFWAQPVINLARPRLEIIGREYVDGVPACIVAATHQSAFDVPLVVGIVSNGRFVAKREIGWLPVFGKAARFGGQIIVNRANTAEAVAALKEGMRVWPDSRLVFFVEGTRSRAGDGELQPFKKGAFRTALDAGLPIIPVAISGARDVLPPDSIWGVNPDVRVTVEFAPPIELEANDTVESLMNRVRVAIEHMRVRHAARASPVG